MEPKEIAKLFPGNSPRRRQDTFAQWGLERGEVKAQLKRALGDPKAGLAHPEGSGTGTLCWDLLQEPLCQDRPLQSQRSVSFEGKKTKMRGKMEIRSGNPRVGEAGM